MDNENILNLKQTCSSYGPMVLRLGLGIIFFMHGYQKLFMQGFDGVAGFFGSVGIPAAMFFAYIVTLLEFIGGILLILGVFVQWVSILLAVDMVVALFVVHLPNGFSVSDGGYEFVLILLFALISLSLSGAGAYALAGRSKKDENATNTE